MFFRVTPYEQELRKLAAGLGDSVEFQPFVDRSRVAAMFDAATIFCVPTNWDDPCPLTVVVSRRGGIPEIGGDAVLYFQPPEIDTLADHLAALLDDEKARNALGRRAHPRRGDIVGSSISGVALCARRMLETYAHG